MTDYRKMYYVLCRAADKAIDLLEGIPAAERAEKTLRDALLEAEEIFVRTAAEN